MRKIQRFKQFFSDAPFARCFACSFLIYLFLPVLFLHAAENAKREEFKVTEVTCSDAKYVKMHREGEKLEVSERGDLRGGDQLPERYCTVCVPEACTVQLLNVTTGETKNLDGPLVFDTWWGTRNYASQVSVQVKAGSVYTQPYVVDENGKKIPVGDPIISPQGSLVLLGPCWERTEDIPLPELEPEASSS